jgi:hypothetical protein
LRLALLAFAIGVLSGCGGGGDDELVRPEKGPSPSGGEQAQPARGFTEVSETLREFRRRYESGNPSACDLTTSKFRMAVAGTSASCENAVEQHRLDYALVTLSRSGNRVGQREAAVLVTLRRDNQPGSGDESTKGVVRLAKPGVFWLIESIRPR